MSIPSLMSLHLRRQNKQKMGGGKACVITGIRYSHALCSWLELPDPKPKSVSINKMCQAPCADPETEQPGTASVHTAKPSFPTKPSGLTHIASWEPSTSPQLMRGQFRNVLVDKGKNEASEHANKHHGLLQANTIFWPCLTCKYRCDPSFSPVVCLRVPALTREMCH